VTSCQKNDEISPKKDTTEIPQTKQDAYFAQVANLISSNIGDDNFRQFLKSEAIKQFDGDYDILFAELLTKNFATKKHPGNKISTLDYLSKNRSKNARTIGVQDSFPVFIEYLLTKYPLLQISIPEVFENSTENWDASDQEVLVAYLPEDYDEGKTLFIQAFDKEGKLHMIDAVNEPDFPVIVVGLNERLEVSSTSTQNSRTKSYFSNEHYNYYLTNNTESIKSKKESLINSRANATYDRDSDGGKEVLYQGRINNKGAWRQIEGWPAGRPEFKVVIGYVDKSSGSAVAQTTTKILDKSGWVKRNLFSSKVTTKTINIPIFTWYKDRYALDMKYIWLELDSGGDNTTEYSYTLVTEFDDGTKSTEQIKTSFDDNDDEAGDQVVQYEDPTSGGGSSYNTGILTFSIIQE